MLFKKSYLIMLLGAFAAVPAQAAFFAYQEWYNPKTGQIIEEYYDLHAGNETIIAKQQHDLVADAKKFGKDCLTFCFRLQKTRALL